MWKCIKINKAQLQLDATLLGGQSFRWKKTSDDEYQGIFANIVWALRQTAEKLEYKVLHELPYDEAAGNLNEIEAPRKGQKSKGTTLYEEEFYSKLISHYFRLDEDLESLYKKWCLADKNFERASDRFYAVRMLRQDPVENLISFICSQNNHIKRISTMIEKLCLLYGKQISGDFYSFPEIQQLGEPKVEQTLRDEGFGYRAKYIAGASRQIIESGGLSWFKQLKELEYKEAHEKLVSLHGIGPKVADCICLMSLGHLEAIPVDTHVFQIARKYFLPDMKQTKSITSKMYAEIGDKFREIYGSRAGWAQTVLFCSDLKQFSAPSPEQEGETKKVKRKRVK